MDGGVRALVAVVAQVGHLGGDTDHRLHRAADRLEPQQPAAAGGEVAHEALLEEVEPRLGADPRERRAPEQQREEGQAGQRELDASPPAPPAPPAARQAAQVAVDVAGDLGGRHLLRLALDQHLRERLERDVAVRAEVPELVARDLRPVVHPHQQHDQRDVDGQPADQEARPGDLGPEPGERRVVTADQHQHLRRDEHDVGERDQQRQPAEAPDVRRGEHREDHEQRVLGRGVRPRGARTRRR